MMMNEMVYFKTTQPKQHFPSLIYFFFWLLLGGRKGEREREGRGRGERGEGWGERGECEKGKGGEGERLLMANKESLAATHTHCI